MNRRGDILAGPGKAWLTDDVSVTQVGSDAAGWQTVASDGTVLDTQGFNALSAGGGKWATWLAGRGPKGNFGPLDPAGYVLDIGSDGTVVWCPSQQAGWPIGILGGTLYPIVALSVRVVGSDHFVCALADGRIWSNTLGYAAIPAGVTPFKAQVVGELLLYHTHEHLILQYYGRPFGRVIAEKPAYSPDMVRTSAGLKVAWCLNEGETVTVSDVFDPSTFTDISGVLDVPLPPPPPPPPEPHPMAGITDAQFATLQAERAKFPTATALTPEQIGTILNATAYRHRNDPGARLGLQAKPSGTAAIQPKTGTRVWNGLRIIDAAGQHWGEDVCGGCSVGQFNPVRAAPGPASPSSFVVPVDAGGVVDPPPPLPPSPPPHDDLAELRLQLASLDAKVTGFVYAVTRNLEQVELRLTAVELKLATTTPTLPTLRVRGNTSAAGGNFLAKAHSHAIDLPVEVVPE